MDYGINGLSTAEVRESRRLYGSNRLTPVRTHGFWARALGTLKDPVILILLAALAINITLNLFGYAKWYEGLGIAIAVAIATAVTTLAEHKNESSFQALQAEAAQSYNKVFRDGAMELIHINDVVTGDCIFLQPGDKIPADGLVVTGEIRVTQAALTGEMESVLKNVPPAGRRKKGRPDLMDPHAVFRGTIVQDGEAAVRIEAVGDASVYGRMAQEYSGHDLKSPLQEKLSKLALGISKCGYAGAIVIALTLIFKKAVLDNGFAAAAIWQYIADWPVFLNDLITAAILATIIIVVAVPEGLPMMIALVLSLNMRNLLRNNVLVRKLIGIETAGSLNILFTDKTGTITRGQLEVVNFISGDGQLYDQCNQISPEIEELLSVSIGYNHSCHAGFSPDGRRQIIGGNLTERALLQFADSHFPDRLYRLEAVKRVPFNSARKFSAVQVKGDLNLTLIKGAPEILLANSSFYYDRTGRKTHLGKTGPLLKKLNKLAGRTVRVIGLAVADQGLDGEELPSSLALVGFISIRDDLRAGLQLVLKETQNAGVQVVMMTGDRKETAVAIARECGIMKDPGDRILISKEINGMSNRDIESMLPNLRVVARASPTDKSRLVKVAQGLGLVAGMTGDGVNDTAALQNADVGFALGSGTEAAKEAGDIVILDDNISSISRAILFGRTIYHSIRKFIVFQFTVNVAVILIAFTGPFLGIDFPLTIVQLLWINLVMDTLAALAFGGEPALAEYMAEKPKRRDEPIINGDMWSSIMVNGLVIALLSVAFLTSPAIKNLFHSEAAFLTGFFAFFVFTHNFNKFNSRTTKLNLFDSIGKNSGFLKVVALIFIIQIAFTYLGGDVLRTVSLRAGEWLFVFLASTVIIPVDLCRKIIRDCIKSGNAGRVKIKEPVLE